ncbi:hypothetical protein GZ77_18550 [Endozoicomonas montiporae]|uniref:DUF4124 domain-containing protein n=2 Tax=Endozoicomonas montiporae TaxID=1027273 RepID=A0A081N244_9GAMM|nr:hypothetical protein [Endozoicomonas montiporae]AMO58528.1 hypothetical protein EZMO1_4621 [Endozoicomonas montiporae CL-33]KEQ12517.1 hypothetical protein GZ77_18550 [Endozoicomonas montiporae]
MFLFKFFTATVLSVVTMTYTSNAQAKTIYKCQVNGTVQFSEEKCGSDAKPVELRGMAAPLQPVDMDKLKSLEVSERIRVLQSRIELRQKRINQYRKRMDREIKALEKSFQAELNKSGKSSLKNSLKNKELSSQVQRLSDTAELTARGNLSEQINSVVLHYQALIRAEDVQISVLMQQLAYERGKQAQQ